MTAANQGQDGDMQPAPSQRNPDVVFFHIEQYSGQTPGAEGMVARDEA